MKKIFIVLIMSLCLTGCKSESVDNGNSNIKESFVIADNASFSPVIREACFSKIYANINELYPDSEYILAGEVIDVAYSDINAVPTTYCTYRIDEVLKGEGVAAGENVIISLFQGYCRVSEYAEVYGNDHFQDFDMSKAETTYFVFRFEQEPMAQIGEKNVIFLNKGVIDDNVNGEYYVPVGLYMGNYHLDENGYYSRYEPSENYYSEIQSEVVMTYSLEENNGLCQSESPLSYDELKAQIEMAARE